jgi:signal transduction histidine kinase
MEWTPFRNGTSTRRDRQLSLVISAPKSWPATCKEESMILLITASARGQQCADSLHIATGEETLWAQNLQAAATRLREQTFSAVVVDQFLLETEPEETERTTEHLGTAYPVYINFGVTGMERLLREVRSALHRRKREEAAARTAVTEQIRSEMRETLTALLLSCELAMSVPDVPGPAAERIRSIDNLARELRSRLQVI